MERFKEMKEEKKDHITEEPQTTSDGNTTPSAKDSSASEEESLTSEAPLTSDATEKVEAPKPPTEKPTGKAKRKLRNKRFVALYALVNFCRFFLAVTFLLSAFFKANDPVGFSIKLSEYAGALGVTNPPTYLLMLFGILLTLTETTLGIYLFVGVRRNRRVAGLSFLFMCMMTLVTLWVALANPVEDCGCFGDAIVLSNGMTLVKNLVLLAMACLLTLRHKMIFSIVPKNWNWLVTIPVVAGMTFYFTFCAYMLPVFDFLPFAEGTNLREKMSRQLEFDDPVIVYTNGTETLELSPQDEDPDSTVWKYVETRRPKPKNNPDAVVDFFVQLRLGDDVVDVTEEMLQTDGYVFVVTAPDLEKASEAVSGNFNSIYDYAEKFGYGFYFIASASEEEKEKWKRNTGAQYDIYESDEKVLWQMVRDNPGLLLMKDGVVIRKWSQMGLPLMDYTKPLDKQKVDALAHTTRFAVKPLHL